MYKRQAALFGEEIHGVLRKEATVPLAAFVAVSYTHLDVYKRQHVNFLLPYQAHFRAVQIPRPSQFEAVGRRWSIGCAKGDDESVDAFSHLKQIVERRSAPPHVSFCSW